MPIIRDESSSLGGTLDSSASPSSVRIRSAVHLFLLLLLILSAGRATPHNESIEAVLFDYYYYDTRLARGKERERE